MSKNPRNPNSAPVRDELGDKPTHRIEVKRVQHPDTLYWQGDFFQFSATADQLADLQAKDPISRWHTIVKKLKIQPKKMPPRDDIGRWFKEDGEFILKEIEGDRLRRNLASGSTLEQISEKRQAEAAQKRKDWLDHREETAVEPVTVDGTPTGDLKPELVDGKTYPPSNPNHPEHQLWLEQEAKRRKRSVESLKASEEKRRKEQAKLHDTVMYRCHECRTEWSQPGNIPPKDCPKCKKGTTRSAVPKRGVK